MSFLKKLKDDKVLMAAFVGLGLVALIMGSYASSKNTEPRQDTESESFDVDTMIPAGFLLVPLQLSNAESLASLSGPFSIVDLYVASDKGRKSFKIANAVKLLRAPLNPQQFAVLVREEDSSKIMGQEGPFFAALKNPKEAARNSKDEVAKNPVIIRYGE